MVTCTLRIGDRVALSSVGGAPEVEYALFDPGEIELASTGPGMVQEVGYQTTADDAIGRMKDAGIPWSLVVETAAAMQPLLATAYARGRAVRRVATSMGAAELFDGFRYDATAKQYEGRWFDLPALGRDMDFPRLTQTLQAMHLVALIREVTAADPIRLITRDLMARARSGQRSFRRGMVPPGAAALPAKLRAFAAQVRDSETQSRVDRADGPSAVDLLDSVRDRMVLTPDAESQDRLCAIERAITLRGGAPRGLLAVPELAAIDAQLSEGKTEGVSQQLDALERTRGKQPALSYLRLRATFLSGRDAPRAIAERIASLALSTPSFAALELLACEAWNAAAEPKRALPFARDLISNSSANEELQVRDSQAAMQAITVPAVPPAAPSQARPSAAPVRLTPPRPSGPITPSPSTFPRTRDLDQPVTVIPAPPTSGPSLAGPDSSPASQDSRRTTKPLPTILGSGALTPRPLKPRPSVPPTPSSAPSLPQPASARKDTPPMMFAVDDPPTVPVPTAAPPAGRAAVVLPKRPISGTWVGPPPAKAGQAVKVTSSNFGAVPPPSPPSDRRPQSQVVTQRTPSQPLMPIARPPSQPQMPVTYPRPSNRPAPEAPRMANRSLSELMRGASQPPYRSDSPDAHVHVPRAPAVPRFDDGAEGASALTLPDGLSGVPDPIETLPRTVLDARVQFTFLARELGREYDEQLGIVLRADISGIEAMQRVLLERYKTRAVTTPEAAADVRRHGAFLSEILARSFGGFWVDIGPSDVGYWAMVVPPGTRVWPFGRILRLIAMQHNERDLVSYFLEIQGRSGAR